MRARRTTRLFATLATLALGAQLAACGGDEGVAAPASPPPPPDAVPGDTPAPTTSPALTISTTRAKLYLGQSAKIEGASVAPEIVAKLAWTVVTAPSESTISNESIEGATTAAPLFKPDRLGHYTLQLSGEKADGSAASVLVFLEALDAPVFFRDLHVKGHESIGEMHLSLSTQVAGAYSGAAARAVGCPVTASTEDEEGGEINISMTFFSARAGAVNGDSWEGPPGSPSRVAFVQYGAVMGEGAPSISSSIGVATSRSACGAPEAKIIETLSGQPGSVSVTPSSVIYNARFSPDGNRIAYTNDVDGGARLSTIGFDGSDKRDLSPATAVGDGTLDPRGTTAMIPGETSFSGLGPIVPRWKDPTHLGWVSFFGEDSTTAERSSWELWVVEDKPGAKAELAMRCTGSGLTHFDFLPDGTIVAAARHQVTTDDDEIHPMDLLVYRANAETKACEIVRNLTNNTKGSGIARDFSLSPDKTTIAFFGGMGNGVPSGEIGMNITVLSTVPVDGSRPAAQVPGALAAADLGVGPRWAAGGSVITWGQADVSASEIAMAPQSHLMSIPAQGGNPVMIGAKPLAAHPPTDDVIVMDYHVTYGMGQGCSAAPGNVSDGIAIVFGVFGAGTLLARRRRSSAR